MRRSAAVRVATDHPCVCTHPPGAHADSTGPCSDACACTGYYPVRPTGDLD